MMERSRLDKVISRIGELPTIPEVVVQVMAKTADPNVSVAEVSDLIGEDPVLTAQLLKISNSSYYGMRQVVGSLKLALVILGVREVRNIVLGIAAIQTLRNDETEFLFSNEGLWAHSALVAATAKKLGGYLELSLQGEDFISGLIHDIGKLVLWKELGGDYRTLYRRAAREGEDLYLLERRLLGFDHADVAGALAESWNLPPSISFAMGAHHMMTEGVLENGPAPKLAALVRVANVAAKDDFSGQPSQTPSCTDEEAWSVLLDDLPAMDLNARWTLLSEFRDELQETPLLVI